MNPLAMASENTVERLLLCTIHINRNHRKSVTVDNRYRQNLFNNLLSLTREVERNFQNLLFLTMDIGTNLSKSIVPDKGCRYLMLSLVVHCSNLPGLSHEAVLQISLCRNQTHQSCLAAVAGELHFVQCFLPRLWHGEILPGLPHGAILAGLCMPGPNTPIVFGGGGW